MKVSRKKPHKSPDYLPSRRRVEMEGDIELSYGEYYEWMIDNYFNGHFQYLETLEFVLENANKLLSETQDDPELQRDITKQIHLAKTELERLHRKTPEILKNSELMRKDFESLK